MNSLLNICLAAVIFTVMIHSCKNLTDRKLSDDNYAAEKVVPENISYRIISPKPNSIYNTGEKIEVRLEKTDTLGVDSMRLFLGDNSVKIIPGGEKRNYISAEGLNPGSSRLRLIVFLSGGKSQTVSIPLKILSDIEPEVYTYRVIKEYPHNIKSYTQGFEYHDGYFYEGTGQYGESSLMKSVYNTGDVIKYKKLSSDLFGEGITVLNGKIYQITYRTQVGFIYDMETFEQIQRIYYQNKEGWGMTNNGVDLIMSDGTNVLYFMDPEYFSIRRKIEVFDNKQAVDSLNELEYIDDLIYANRYLSDQIVIIDPLSGKVKGSVNMKGLLKQEDRQSRTDVLNGIAWDSENRRLFVTGKYWPKIFHVELISE